MNSNRDILKQILSGALNPDQAASLLRTNAGNIVFPHWHEATGLYSFNGEKNLTKEQLLARTKGSELSVITIKHCAIPLAYSEQQIRERDGI